MDTIILDNASTEVIIRASKWVRGGEKLQGGQCLQYWNILLQCNNNINEDIVHFLENQLTN